jgi:hypothetical protein
MTRPEDGAKEEENIMELAQLQQAWTERGFIDVQVCFWKATRPV